MVVYCVDRLDKEILRLIQHDASLSVNDIAEQVGLTSTPCWRRIQLMESQGIIDKRVALLDPGKLGLGMTVFVQIKAGNHDAKWLTEFAQHAGALEEVVECYRMSGEYDYLLKVIVANMQSFDVFYKRLVAGTRFNDVTSSFAMEQIKYTTALPIT